MFVSFGIANDNNPSFGATSTSESEPDDSVSSDDESSYDDDSDAVSSSEDSVTSLEFVAVVGDLGCTTVFFPT